VLEALRARRRALVRLLVAGREGDRRAALLAAARDAGVAVEQVAPDQLRRGLPPGTPEPAQGVALEAGPLPEVALEDLGSAAPTPRTIVALDGVEDPRNLGAIARVAEASGACGLLLTRRRSAPLSPVATRASAGGLEWLPVARVANLARALDALRGRGYWVFAGDPGAEEDLFALPDRLVRGDRVVVLGAEGRGLRPAVEGRVDHRVRIPMVGRIASLNVSAAAAVLLFELRRRSPPASPAAGGEPPGEQTGKPSPIALSISRNSDRRRVC
jgi:23S rRNA (guanosine2251-2'-O)-methyltransferase